MGEHIRESVGGARGTVRRVSQGRVQRDHKQALYEQKVASGEVVGYHWLDYDTQSAILAKIFAPAISLAKQSDDLGGAAVVEKRLHNALTLLWNRLFRQSGAKNTNRRGTE